MFVALTVLPAFAHILFKRRRLPISVRGVAYGALVLIGVAAGFWISVWAGLPMVLGGLYLLLEPRLPRGVVRLALDRGLLDGPEAELVQRAQAWLEPLCQRLGVDPARFPAAGPRKAGPEVSW